MVSWLSVNTGPVCGPGSLPPVYSYQDTGDGSMRKMPSLLSLLKQTLHSKLVRGLVVNQSWFDYNGCDSTQLIVILLSVKNNNCKACRTVRDWFHFQRFLAARLCTMVLIRNSGYVLLSLIYLGLSQLPEVQSGRVRTFSGSIFAQETKSEVDVRKKTRHCALGHFLRHFS